MAPTAAKPPEVSNLATKMMQAFRPGSAAPERPAGSLTIGRANDNDIVIGAMTTQHELIASDLVASKIPILREAALLIADPQVRYVGTVGGNVANGDPANDMPAIMMCLGAVYQVTGRAGERRVPARRFYQGAYVTALQPTEILTAIRIPTPAARHDPCGRSSRRSQGGARPLPARPSKQNRPAKQRR